MTGFARKRELLKGSARECVIFEGICPQAGGFCQYRTFVTTVLRL